MKNNILWIFFFLICMGVGFLHGVLPQGLSKSYFISPTKIQVLTTDEIFFPPEIRKTLEDEFNVKFSVTVTRDWDSIIANTVSSPSVDLLFLPSFWAHTLAHQNLLANVAGTRGELLQRVASDFTAAKTPDQFFFLPFYWIKTGIRTPSDESFTIFLKNKNDTTLFLLADEDLILKHFQVWKEQGLWEQVAQKKILTLQLDQLTRRDIHEEAIETPLSEDIRNELPQLSALLIYGAAIPANAPHKKFIMEILDEMTSSELQEKHLLKTPFNSAFSTVTANEIPLQRRASFIRDLQLKDVILLESKDQDSKKKLKEEFNFIL
ncbi:hypothetical protein QJS83_11110 [Bdellovibrio sp. 22V]|uniref:hypothetical protein n=1 Tax=Bdellovibrio TaxID=958 RepID=UPI002542EC16|nr:hypothetical protein [Bdellovibrio sp. 22V]WII71010.1 hypothetical protein QJS83_11110 [Bdellovibrio sp. 22V]